MSEMTLDEKVLSQFLKHQNNLMEQTDRLIENQYVKNLMLANK